LSSIQIWIMASRPKTLPAAAAPVLAALGLAVRDGVFRPEPALAALMAALLLQVGANLANDVFDYQRGADTEERLGPRRVTATGMLTPAQVKTGMWVVFGLAGLLGIYLISVGGWPVLFIGVLAILAAIGYTGGPFPLGYYGMGDLSVFVFFGLAAVGGTYYVQAGVVSEEALWTSLPMGLLTVAILVVNNLRDIETDRAAGKHTLAVRFGKRGARFEYGACLLISYLAPALMWLAGAGGPGVMLTWFSIPLAMNMLRSVYTIEGRALNKVLAGTGRLELVFGLLLGLGFILG
jgi:1,4-dihydroxy-2-naphthoate octaprenyltransferase